tara:strand:+ start:2325 stop:2819 length:495 start_codon:yes stop_codon:yes gene_type:complete
MVKIYHAGARGNIVRTDQGLATVVAGLFLLGGTYQLFFKKEPESAPARPITKLINLELSHYLADVSAIGFTRTRVSDGDTVVGAKEQIQLNFRLSGDEHANVRVKYGSQEKTVATSPGAQSVSIPKLDVINELNSNGYLQIEVSVLPGPSQADTRPIRFRYEGA